MSETDSERETEGRLIGRDGNGQRSDRNLKIFSHKN